MKKTFKLIIVEGESRELKYFQSISNFFGDKINFCFILLPAGQNIYMLWNKLREDNFETDIVELIREMAITDTTSIQGIAREQIDEIFLFFDFDAHQDNIKEELKSHDVVKEMLQTFSNETELGKLYISYPMIEALRDFSDDICKPFTDCTINFSKVKYKTKSGDKNPNADIRKYDETKWKHILNFFIARISCLFKHGKIIDYNDYRKIDPKNIYDQEKEYLTAEQVFIISAIPEFLLDYFDQIFWDTYISVEQVKKGCFPHSSGDKKLQTDILN